MAGKSISKTLVWILLGLLILGLGGFGVTNLSGTVRSIGNVGDAEIDVQDYFRGLRQEIAAIEAARGESISFARAREMGVSEAVLGRLIATAALEHETAALGLSVGDENLRDQIVGMRQFAGLDGAFDRDAYAFSLEQAGLSEGEFEEDIRAETARSFLQAAVMAGVEAPEGYTGPLTDYLGERREVSWAILERDDLATGLPVPVEDDLKTYHAANEALFTRPEVKTISYAWLTPEMIIDTVEVDEKALRDAYEAREAEFNQPERRLVERLVFPDAAAADAAKARLDAEEVAFEDLVAERGLELSDIDLGDVTRDDLEDAADAVFAAEVGSVAGPAPSALGPALFRVNAILSQQVTTFQDALPDLRAELAADRARRVIDARIDPVDDLLAGGATVEDLGAETDMEAGQIDWHAGLTDGIGAYEAFREAAAALTEEDYPEVRELEDGGIFAMRLDAVLPPAVQPLDEVREAVEAAWQREALVAALKEQVAPQLEQLQAGASFDEAGLTIDGARALTRRDFATDAPADFIDIVFGMEDGAARLIEGDGRVFVLRLDAVQPPDPEDADLQRLQALLREQAATGLSQDLFQVLANDIRARAGINLDQSALNAVHANFQ